MNTLLVIAAAFLAADDCPVDVTGTNMTFAVTFEIDAGTTSFQQKVVYGPGKNVFSLPTGEHTIEGHNTWRGFPQNVTFTIKEDQAVVWKSEPTADHARLIKLEAGQRLEIEVDRPYEAYNTKFFRVADVDMAINFSGLTPGRMSALNGKLRRSFPIRCSSWRTASGVLKRFLMIWRLMPSKL